MSREISLMAVLGTPSVSLREGRVQQWRQKPRKELLPRGESPVFRTRSEHTDPHRGPKAEPGGREGR